ncbi:uncharacterized protein LOC127290117 [Leptopilina boulardi]|uniref:uncharacterized protein LOC127290117 n=1 Tax=Leptopilina boulardi TaxID=63433 RepID=UPI0021F584C7|nr:uncharacterized protein LOC127290117 [Leptopilina boulardi]
MNCRNKKAFDFVAVEKNIKENFKKNEIIQTKWLQRFEWILDDYKLMQEELANLRKGNKMKTNFVCRNKNERTIRPIPVTTTGEYGWLASKSEFQLENPWDYIVKFPNPMNEVRLLKGNIPSLTPGIGHFC